MTNTDDDDADDDDDTDDDDDVGVRDGHESDDATGGIDERWTTNATRGGDADAGVF